MVVGGPAWCPDLPASLAKACHPPLVGSRAWDMAGLCLYLGVVGMNPPSEFTFLEDEATTRGSLVSGVLEGPGENTSQILATWVKNLYLKGTPAPVCSLWPCSRTGHLDSAPGKESTKRVSWGHWNDTGPRKGPSFLLACRAVCPTPGWPSRSGPSKGKAT